MKKLLLSFVMLFVLSLMTNAQMLLNEGFENGIPSTWTTIDNDNDGNGWTVGTSPQINCNGGSSCVYSASYLSGSGALTPDNWLITPQVNLTGNSTLTFHVCGQDASYCSEHYAVLLSTTGTAVSNFTTVLLEETFSASRTPTAYVTKTIDLSAYTGQNVYIAFRHYNVTDQFYLNIDDISIFSAPTTPTIIAAETSHDFGTIPVGDTASWSTTITNYNLTQAVNASVLAPFAVSADGVTYGTTATIPATGGTLYVSYTPTSVQGFSYNVTLTSAGAPSVDIVVEGEGIDCDSLSIPYTSTFTDVDMLCWEVIDANNDGSTFANNNDEMYAYYYYNEDNDADDYLVAPQLTFDGSQYLAFEYSVASSSYPEAFEVIAWGATDTVQLMAETTVDNAQAITKMIDLGNLNGNYRIAFHCTSDANMYSLLIENFLINDYGNGQVVLPYDSLHYGVKVMGQEYTAPIAVTCLGVTSNVTYNATAPFQVSLDNVNFSSQVVRTAPSANILYDTVYVKFAPTTEAVFTDYLTVTYLSNVDTIVLDGEAVDCSAGIAQFPYTYDFNTGIYPPVCWTVNDESNFSKGQMEEGDYALVFLAVDRLVTPEIHTTNPLLFTFDYKSYAGSQAVTSFQVGYSTDDIDTGYTWTSDIIADADEVETYTAIIPANAKYVAVKVTEMNEFTYWFWTYPNYLFVDNFSFTEITEPMMMLSADELDFGGLEIGEETVQTVNVATALLTSPITVAGQAEFTVSADGSVYGASATLPAEGGMLYVKYAPTAEGTHTANITLTSGATTANIDVEGRAYDCSAPIATLPFFEGFESEISACWENIDEDGDGNYWGRWEAGSDYAFQGTGVYISASYINNVGALTPDNWLISPVITIPAEGAELSWYVAALDGNYPNEHYSVLIEDESVEGAEPQMIYQETLNSASWAFKHVPLLDYVGKNIRFIFRHHNCTDNYQIMLDNVQVSAGTGIESHEVSFGVYPNPASNMINISASENMTQIQVLNMAGQCVYSSRVAGNNTQVSVANMADGMYFVKIYTDNGGVSTQKIVVRK